jgi:hypothetical protein
LTSAVWAETGGLCGADDPADTFRTQGVGDPPEQAGQGVNARLRCGVHDGAVSCARHHCGSRDSILTGRVEQHENVGTTGDEDAWDGAESRGVVRFVGADAAHQQPLGEPCTTI